MHYGRGLGVGDGKLANRACHEAHDLHSKQPELKYCAVNVAKVSP